MMSNGSHSLRSLAIGKTSTIHLFARAVDEASGATGGAFVLTPPAAEGALGGSGGVEAGSEDLDAAKK